MDRLEVLTILENELEWDINETYKMNEEYGWPLRKKLERLLKETQEEMERILSLYYSD